MASRARKAMAIAPLRLPALHPHRASNGLELIAIPRGPLPLVTLRLMIRAGSARDPNGKHGLADFTANMLRRGTQTLSGDAINDAIEFVGAQLSIGVAEDFTAVRLSTPTEHLEQMIDILAQLIAEPAFAADEIASAKTRTIAELANELDDPSSIADRALVHHVLAGHPYGHPMQGEKRSVATFTRDDVERFHGAFLVPDHATLYAVGDVEPERFFTIAARAFERWRSTGVVLAPLPALAKEQVGGVLIVDKPDQTQTQVRLAARAFPRRHPDYMPSIVTNTAFGGGFTSRLVNEVRVNRGLSYGVHSMFDTMAAGGWFGISTFTKSATTRKIIDVCTAETKKLRARGLKPSELEATQRYVSGLFPLRTETNDQIASAVGDARLFDLGDDWLERYRERVHAVTAADSKRVAQQHFFPHGAATVLVGKASEIEPQVRSLGDVVVKKVSELE